MLARPQYLMFCLFEMYVNVVFVIRRLCSAVSLTLVKEQGFIRIIIIIIIIIIRFSTWEMQCFLKPSPWTRASQWIYPGNINKIKWKSKKILGDLNQVFFNCVFFCFFFSQHPYVKVYNSGACQRIQELCESRGGRPGLLVLTSLMVFRGRKAISNHAHALVSACP